MIRTNRGRSNTMSKSIRAVFDLEDSQLSLNSSKEKIVTYSEIKKHYFQQSISSEIGNPPDMLSENSSSSERESDLSTPNESNDIKLNNGGKDPAYQNELEKAILESEGYLVLSREDIYKIKTELLNLTSRSQSLTERYELETKVRDAALSLRQLHSSNKKMMDQAEEQLEKANDKLNQLISEIWQVKNQIWSYQKRLSQHHAAILVLEVKRKNKEDNRSNMAVISESFSRKKERREDNGLERALSLLDKKEKLILELQKEREGFDYESLKEENFKLKLEVGSKKEIEKQLAIERVEKEEMRNKLKLTEKENELLIKSKGEGELIQKLKECQQEVEKHYSRNLKINEQLAALYHQLPNFEDEKEENQRYNFQNFLQTVQNLVLENQDLIDKMLILQDRNSLLETKIQNYDNEMKNKLSINEVEELLYDIDNELNTIKMENENLKNQMELEKKNQLKMKDEWTNDKHILNNQLIELQKELETKDLLCVKYQQILNNL
ncbi:hypothetical protein K502DRAFT_363533 [Neoconidiobolus thromboides FSU 785]|nr:hypothetical protein K502DRAFT_363533 [Neoconidiobolus thromboides FSU 785]